MPFIGLLQLLGVPLLLFGVLGVCLRRPPYQLWEGFAGAGLILVLVRPLYTWSRFLGLSESCADFEVVVHESGVETKGSGTANSYRWSDFGHFSEESKDFVLFLAADVVLLPKRALGGQELDIVRKLLQRNLLPWEDH